MKILPRHGLADPLRCRTGGTRCFWQIDSSQLKACLTRIWHSRYVVLVGRRTEAFAHTKQDADTPKPLKEHTIPALVRAALNAVDTETRPNLLNNVVVAGAGSLVQGVTRRIDLEINVMYPGPRVRVYAPGQVVERKYASWIGGSILGSLGTFHQMWISKKEYEEHGPNIIEKRCK